MRTGSTMSLYGPAISLCLLPVEFSANYAVFVIRVWAASLPLRDGIQSLGQGCGLGKSQNNVSDTLVLIAITTAEKDATTRMYLCMNKVF